MALPLLFLLCLSAFASAFSGTYPIVTWSSEPSNILQSLSATFEAPNSPIHQIISDDDICGHDAIILIEHNGVHASDLRLLAPSSSFARYLSNPLARSYPYVPIHSQPNFTSTLNGVSSHCDFRAAIFEPGTGIAFNLDYKYAIVLKMPPLDVHGAARRSVVNAHGDLLSTELDNLASIFPDYVAIYTGSSSPLGLANRQSLNVFDGPASHAATDPSFQAVSNVGPKGGILKRYQLLTPGLISALLVVLFILLPAVLLGTNALAGIKSPLRVVSVRGYDAREKKIQ